MTMIWERWESVGRALGEGKGFLIIGAVSRKGGSIEDIRQ
jgi:hypothetical protein